MKKTLIILTCLLSLTTFGKAQNNTGKSFELGVGLISQQTNKLYWENGIGIDFAGDFLLDRHLHTKLSYITSRVGSAMGSNAIKQDYYILGFDWRFRQDKDFQIFAGLNTGYFMADYGADIFNELPSSSVILAPEAGLVYKFKIPLTLELSAGYNIINGDGFNVPGTLFPVYYKLSVLYNLEKVFGK